MRQEGMVDHRPTLPTGSKNGAVVIQPDNSNSPAQPDSGIFTPPEKLRVRRNGRDDLEAELDGKITPEPRTRPSSTSPASRPRPTGAKCGSRFAAATTSASSPTAGRSSATWMATCTRSRTSTLSTRPANATWRGISRGESGATAAPQPCGFSPLPRERVGVRVGGWVSRLSRSHATLRLEVKAAS